MKCAKIAVNRIKFVAKGSGEQHKPLIYKGIAAGTEVPKRRRSRGDGVAADKREPRSESLRAEGCDVTPGRARAGESGFTLLEVLMAMVIVAIGVLGLEALGISAARSIEEAARLSGQAVIAADSLESAMHQLRQQTMPAQFCRTDLPRGDRLSRSVELSNPRLANVTVRVERPPGSTGGSDAFTVTSSLFLPVAPAGPIVGEPCG